MNEKHLNQASIEATLVDSTLPTTMPSALSILFYVKMKTLAFPLSLGFVKSGLDLLSLLSLLLLVAICSVVLFLHSTMR